MALSLAYDERMLIYGRNPILEALSSGIVERVYVADGVETRFARELEAACEAADVGMEWVSRIELDQAVGTTQHQGVVPTA